MILSVNGIANCGTVVAIAIRSRSCSEAQTLYYANIYVVQDPAHPENEVVSSSTSLLEDRQLVEAMQPAFADETPVDPFNFWKGADFKLKIMELTVTGTMTSLSSLPNTLGNFDDDKLGSSGKRSLPH